MEWTVSSKKNFYIDFAFADISQERTVQDINSAQYFIDYNPMALCLNNEHEDYNSERLRTYESSFNM